jgi:hypothetical protein
VQFYSAKSRHEIASYLLALVTLGGTTQEEMTYGQTLANRTKPGPSFQL